MGRITLPILPWGLPAYEVVLPSLGLQERLELVTMDRPRTAIEVLEAERLDLVRVSLARLSVPTDLPAAQPPTPGNFILLESGDYLLLESGDRIPLEN